MSKKCATPGCTDPVRTAGYCDACYSFHRYWSKFTVGARVNHAKKLNKQNKRRRAVDLIASNMPNRRAK